jgi:hypothetical protein
MLKRFFKLIPVVCLVLVFAGHLPAQNKKLNIASANFEVQKITEGIYAATGFSELRNDCGG